MKNNGKLKQLKKESFHALNFINYYSNLVVNYFDHENIYYFEDESSKPDFYYQRLSWLIEVKEIHDKQDKEKWIRWETIVNNLQKELEKTIKSYKPDSMVSVEVPHDLYLSPDKKKIKEYTQKILQSIIEKKQTIQIDRYIFKISYRETESKIKGIYFSSWGGGGSFSPANTIFNNIKNKVGTANKQLGFQIDKPVKKRILLLVNKYQLFWRIEELIEALSWLYNELLSYNNIDEIWFQYEKNGKTKNKLIYTKDFLINFEKKNIKPQDKNQQYLFELWYWALDKLSEKKDQIYSVLKTFTDYKKPNELFPDPYKRQYMVKIVTWLLDNNRIKEAIEIINRFIDDPDPVEHGNYIGDKDFNYDEQIRNNQDVNTITTVKGFLAWEVQALARKSERHKTGNLIKAFEFTKKVLTSTNNFYVIQQWLIPLIEISNRRLWILEEKPEVYKDFRKLILGIEEKKREDSLVYKYSKYLSFSHYLNHIFQYFKDLNDEEVKFVIDNLYQTEEGINLLIYFALFRERHYKKETEVGKLVEKIDPKILKYNSNYAKKILNEISEIKDNKIIKFQRNIAWQYWKILEENKQEFCHLVEWIYKLFDLNYDQQLYSNLFRIIKDCYGIKTECENPSFKWLLTYVNKAKKSLETNKNQRVNIWLDIDELMNKVAESKPEQLIEIVSDLTNIWLANAYIGDLTVIFSSYQQIQNQRMREKTKVKFKKLYGEIRKANPKVKEIIFI